MKRSRRGAITLATALVAALGLAASGAAADPLNGGFESGSLGPWVLSGSGGVFGAEPFQPDIPPPGGQYMGYITTQSDDFSDDRLYDDLDGNGERENEFSSLSISLPLEAPSLVRFELDFLTAESDDADLLGLTMGSILEGPYPLLFATAGGLEPYTGNATPLTAEDWALFASQGPIDSQFGGRTGFRPYSLLLGPGSHTLTFFVIDSGSDGIATAMLVDNLTVTSVPEPGTAALLALGLAGLGLRRRRRA